MPVSVLSHASLIMLTLTIVDKAAIFTATERGAWRCCTTRGTSWSPPFTFQPPDPEDLCNFREGMQSHGKDLL